MPQTGLGINSGDQPSDESDELLFRLGGRDVYLQFKVVSISFFRPEIDRRATVRIQCRSKATKKLCKCPVVSGRTLKKVIKDNA